MVRTEVACRSGRPGNRLSSRDHRIRKRPFSDLLPRRSLPACCRQAAWSSGGGSSQAFQSSSGWSSAGTSSPGGPRISMMSLSSSSPLSLASIHSRLRNTAASKQPTPGASASRPTACYSLPAAAFAHGASPGPTGAARVLAKGFAAQSSLRRSGDARSRNLSVRRRARRGGQATASRRGA